MARHRISARQSHRSRHSGTHELGHAHPDVLAGGIDPPDRTGAPQVDQAARREQPGAPYEVALDRAPVNARAAIQRYWAEGLDVHDIAGRLAGYGVTIHNILVERYLYPGTGAR